MTRAEAIDALDNLLGMIEDNHGTDYDEAIKMAIDALKQPERKTGKWNYIQAGMTVCPYCGARSHDEYKNFCANCGAKMKGGDDADNNQI